MADDETSEMYEYRKIKLVIMPYFGLLSLPYVPNRVNKRKMPWLVTHNYVHRIAYAEDRRGINDDIPTLLFYGASFELLKDVCTSLFKMMNGKVKNLVIDSENACRWKNGKCYRRTMIMVHGLDEEFIGIKEFFALIVALIKKICNCTVRYYRLETFVNL